MNNAAPTRICYNQSMAKKLNYIKKYNKNNTIQIGDDDDAATPIRKIRNQVRNQLMLDNPHLNDNEIERRTNRIMNRQPKH